MDKCLVVCRKCKARDPQHCERCLGAAKEWVDESAVQAHESVLRRWSAGAGMPESILLSLLLQPIEYLVQAVTEVTDTMRLDFIASNKAAIAFGAYIAQVIVKDVYATRYHTDPKTKEPMEERGVALRAAIDEAIGKVTT